MGISNILIIIFSGMVAIATVFYVILTGKLVKVQTEPIVFIRLEPHEEYPGLTNLVIQNIGQGAAYNLKFELNPDFEYRKDKYLSNVSFIKNGIKYLAPNQVIKHFLTSIIGRNDLKEKKFEFKVKYKNDTGKKEQKTYILDLSEFFGLSRVGESNMKEINKSLKEIKKYIGNISKKLN